MFEKAKKFVLEQRIVELKKAIARTPDSPRNLARRLELSEKEVELEEVLKKLLSS